MSFPSQDILAVEPLPDEDSPLLHHCEDGHAWIEQPDGTVSPSWGYGGTHHAFPGHDPKTCPEPERDADRRYECPGCHGRFFTGHGTPGVMYDPWNYEDGCSPPPPSCLKPAAKTARWMRVKKMLPTKGSERATHATYEPGWTHSWVPLAENGAADPEHVREPTLF